MVVLFLFADDDDEVLGEKIEGERRYWTSTGLPPCQQHSMYLYITQNARETHVRGPLM